jgi:hypothetical protein
MTMTMAARMSAMRRQRAGELAVDDVVAPDGLRQQARQRPLGTFVVDGVEAERDPEQRTQEGDPGHQGRQVRRADREELQEDGRRSAGQGSDIADPATGRDDGGDRRQAKAERQEQEPKAMEVVGCSCPAMIRQLPLNRRSSATASAARPRWFGWRRRASGATIGSGCESSASSSA